MFLLMYGVLDVSKGCKFFNCFYCLWFIVCGL